MQHCDNLKILQLESKNNGKWKFICGCMDNKQN